MKKFILPILSVINTAATAIYISMCENEIIPVHYNVNGEADGFASKWFMLILPIALAVVSVVDMLYGMYVEKKDNKNSNSKYLSKVTTGLYFFMAVIFWVVTVICLNGTMLLSDSFFGLICIMMGVMMIYLGNFLGKLKKNSIIGVRTPATKKSDVVWRKTNRLGGLLGVIAGIGIIICGIFGLIFPEIASILLIVGLVAGIIFAGVVPTIYASVILAKEEKNKK